MRPECHSDKYYPLNFPTGLYLDEEGYYVPDLLDDMQASGNDTLDVLHNWTGLSRKEMVSGLWSRDKDQLIPHIEDIMTSKLQPWLEYGEELPQFSILEIARDSQLHPAQLANLINRNSVRIFNYGVPTHFAHASLGFLPNEVTLGACKK